MFGFIERMKASLNKMSLRKRLIILISFIIFLSLSISNYIVMSYSRNYVMDLSEKLIGNTIDQVARNVSELLISRVYTLSEMIMQDEDTYRIFVNNVTLEYLSSRDAEIEELNYSNKIRNNYLLSFDGIRILSLSGKNGRSININYTNSFSQEAREEVNRIISECKRQNTIVHWYPLETDIFSNTSSGDERNNQIVLASRALLRPGTGEYIGTVIFAIPEKTIYNAYAGTKLGNTGEIFIYGLSSGLFSHSDINKLKQSSTQKDLEALLKNTKKETFHTYEDGNEQMVFIKPLKKSTMIAVGKVPVNEISEKVSLIFIMTVLMILVFILISFVLITILIRNIIKPINKLIAGMKKAEKGNLDIHIDVKGQYEISELAGYFNNMIFKIRKLINEEYELEKKKKEAELNVLMGQITPHFLYNTLESIIWKAQLAGETDICDMASALGNLYRISVNRGNLLVLVEEEIEHVRAYIDIQKLRYKEKINCSIIVDDESILKLYTLKMILQPIVENALTYGVEITGSPEIINILIEQKDNTLVFSVSDNGIGILPEKLKSLRKEIESPLPYTASSENAKNRKGIGLRNINERIKLYFGNEYGLTIESIQSSGTVIKAIIPVIRDEDYHL